MPSLRELWKKDPTCRKCRRPTVLPDNNPVQPHTATVEHIYPKGHPDREKNKRKTTLYCHECNKIANIFYHRTGRLYSEHPKVLTWEGVKGLKQVKRLRPVITYLQIKKAYRL